MRKICVVTGTRAEYGLLYWLMKKILQHPILELQIISTGMHMSHEFGLTYKLIEKDGFNINKKIEMVLSADTPSAISKSTGLGMISISDAYTELKPDIIILLGDRYELLAAANVALFHKIPVAHIHGGETTVGAFDEAIRHSITKIAWWHFVAAKEYKDRVVQLGENPKRVFNVGGMGVDGIKRSNLLDKASLEKKLGFTFGKKNLMVTYHPVTLDNNNPYSDIDELLNSLKNLNDTKVIFTLSNSDTNSRIINEKIKNFASTYNEFSKYFTSMGQKNYLSSLQYVDCVIGNSSSGLLEAPTFKIGTINIGDRQSGRLKANSVIDCIPKTESINNALKKVYSKDFQMKLSNTINPYGNGKSCEKIIDVLTTSSIPKEVKKEFYDL